MVMVMRESEAIVQFSIKTDGGVEEEADKKTSRNPALGEIKRHLIMLRENEEPIAVGRT